MSQLIEKLEIQEKEEKKKISKNLDNYSYSKILQIFYKNHEIISIMSQEIFEIIEEMDLFPVSDLLQKIIKNFQLQLNKFLLFQFQYIRHIKHKTDSGSYTNMNSMLNIISENEIQISDLKREISTDGFNKRISKIQKNNTQNLNKMEKNLKNSFSVLFQNFKKNLHKKSKETTPKNHDTINENTQNAEENNPFQTEDTFRTNTKESEKDISLREENKTIERERELADMNNILDNKEKRMEQLEMIEARNIAAHSELVNVRNDIHKNKNSKVIYTGENLDFLLETEKINKKIHPNNASPESENDDILRIPYFSKTGNKVIKNTVNNVKKIVEEIEEEKKNEAHFISASHKTRVKVNQYDLRAQKQTLVKNKGTEPDPEIFDINKIYVYETLLAKKEAEIDNIEEELRNKNANIRELNAINEFQRVELKSTKENLEMTLTKLAEVKLTEANLNFEDNNLKKIILNLQKEVGTLEIKMEKKEEEFEELKSKYYNIKEQIKEIKKVDELIMKENGNLKKEIQFLNLTTQRQSENYHENEHKLHSQLANIEMEIKIHKRNSIDELQIQENYIAHLEDKLESLLEENKMFQNRLQENNHQLELSKIDADKAKLSINLTSPLTSRKTTEENAEQEKKKLEEDEKEPIKSPILKKNRSSRFNFNNQNVNSLRQIPSVKKTSKETQTVDLEKTDQESQTTNPVSEENKIYNILNQESQKIKIVNNVQTPKNYHLTTNPSFHENLKNNILEQILKPIPQNTNNTFLEDQTNFKTPKINKGFGKNLLASPTNNINELIKPSPIIFPTKMQDKLPIGKKITTKKSLKDLNIKINSSIENLKFSASKTERFEGFPQTARNKELERHQRHFSSINERDLKNALYTDRQKEPYNDGSLSLHENNRQINEAQNSDLKNVFELNLEEKEKRINHMFLKFQNKMENLKNKNFKRNKEDKEDEKLLNFADFRDYFLNFIEAHKKCGIDCVHLKRFYEKIGWVEEKNTRKQIKPIKSIISSLPKIKN